jgi:putative membrane protein
MNTAFAMMLTLTLATVAHAQQPPAGAAPEPADHAFVLMATQLGIAEVELGKLAVQKTQRDDVKKFALQMIDDHGKAGSELKAIAIRKNIAVPSDTDAEHKLLYTRLLKLSGAAFDQAYMQAMVDGHRKVAADVNAEARDGQDAEVRAWAAKTLPTIDAHLKHAQSVSGSVHPAGSTQ